jgi:hypothetical protein
LSACLAAGLAAGLRTCLCSALPRTCRLLLPRLAACLAAGLRSGLAAGLGTALCSALTRTRRRLLLARLPASLGPALRWTLRLLARLRTGLRPALRRWRWLLRCLGGERCGDHQC